MVLSVVVSSKTPVSLSREPAAHKSTPSGCGIQVYSKTQLGSEDVVNAAVIEDGSR